MRAKIASSLLLLLALGCGGKSGPPTGAKCVVNTDCNNPLSCTFGVCHEVCHETRDCPEGHRCINAPGGSVCQMQATCAYKSDCPTPLVCALDRQCRNECQTDVDCTKGQTCVQPDKVCAETTEVDTGGKLKNSQSMPVPDAPDGGADAMASVMGDGGVATTEAGAAAGDAGTIGPSADAPVMPPVDAPLLPDMNVGDIPIGPCGFQDPNEPTNDDRNTSTPLTPGVPVLGCVAGKSAMVDADYYELVAPAGDAAGGYYQISLSDVGDGVVGLTILAADNSNILDPKAPPNAGASLNTFFSASPGQHYRLLVAYGTYDFLFKQPFRYTITATYTKLNDTFEPNDNRAAAKAISLGAPITAYSFSGFTTGHANYPDGTAGPVASDDWYKVDGIAAGGMLKATVVNTAADVRILLSVYDPLGTKLVGADSSTFGAGAAAMTPAMAAGSYYILVEAYYPGPQSAGVGPIPQSFTMPYTLTATQ